MVVALEKANIKPLERAIFLDVQLENALAQFRNPVLRLAVAEDVADVEVPADLGLSMASRNEMACSGLVMKLFQTFSMAILTPSSTATGTTRLISRTERRKQSS